MYTALCMIITLYVIVAFLAYTENPNYKIVINGKEYNATKQGEKIASYRIGCVKHNLKYDKYNNMYISYFGNMCKVKKVYNW